MVRLFSFLPFQSIFDPLKNYYQILRVSRQAGPDEIKRAYRRLAILFHPDKNRSPEAATLFQEINEAHEVLADPFSRQRYDLSLLEQLISAAPRTGAYRDPAYRRRQAGYRQPKKGPSEKLLMMLHLLKYLRTASFVGIAWCAVLTFDYILPFRVSEEIILPVGNQKLSWELNSIPDVLVTSKGNQFPVDHDGVRFFPVGAQIEVLSSKMFNILVRVEAPGDRYTIKSLSTIYQNLMIIPLVLLLVSVVGLLVKQGIELRFNILIGICILLAFNAVFLYFSIL